MNGVIKALDVLGSYVGNLENEVQMLRREVERLKEQLQAATKAEA